METPPQSPDCILSLRDGTLLGVASSRLGGLLKHCNCKKQTYSLPIYCFDDDPDAIKLMCSLYTDKLDPNEGAIPPITTLVFLAQLCVNTGHVDLCDSHIIPWTNRWMLSSLDDLKAGILEIALICNHRKTIMDVFRAFLFARVANVEIRAVNSLMSILPAERKCTSNATHCTSDVS